MHLIAAKVRRVILNGFYGMVCYGMARYGLLWHGMVSAQTQSTLGRVQWPHLTYHADYLMYSIIKLIVFYK